MERVKVNLVSHYFGHRLPLSMEKGKYDSLIDAMGASAPDIGEFLFFEEDRVRNDRDPRFFTRYQLRKIARFFPRDDRDYFDKIEICGF